MTQSSAVATSSAPAPLLRAMIVLRSVELAWTLLTRLALLALSATATSSLFTTFDRVSSVAWALTSIAGFALMTLLARSLGSLPPASLAWGAVALSAIDTVLSLSFAAESLVGLHVSALFHALGHGTVTGSMMALGLAFDVLFWMVLVRIGRGCLTPSWTITYWALRSAALLLALPSLLPPEAYRALFIDSPYGTALTLGRFAFAVAHGLTAILALAKVARTAAAVPVAAEAVPPPAKASPQRDVLVGGLWLAGGVVVTLASYSMASSGSGGRYVITTGAIAYGLVRLVRGLMKLGDG